MLAIPSRHRPLALLAGVVLAQVLLLAVQIKRERDVRLIRVWAVAVLTPLQQAGTSTIDAVQGVWRSYIQLRDVRRENEELRQELARLKLRSNALESRAAEAARLATLLDFREAHPEFQFLAARVISGSAVGSAKTIYINRGANDGVERNFAVITPDGVVGKVLEAFPNTSQVLLMTDKESGVGALLEGTRTLGVVRGTGEPELLLHYVANEERVAAGARVLTSGQDRVFPKDLPVGTVARMQPGNPFQVIHLRPAARLDRLEEVLIVLSSPAPGPEEKKPAERAARNGSR